MADPVVVTTGSSWWDYVRLNFGFLGFLISLVLAGVKGYEIFNSRKDRSRDQQSKVNDAWFKTIVLDGAVPQIRTFLESQRNALRQAANARPGTVRPYMNALLKYMPESEELMIRLIPIEELSANAYATVVRNLETLEDAVSPFCSHADDAAVNPQAIENEWINVQKQMDHCFRDCLSILRHVHFDLSYGRDPDKTIPLP
jgi:hypothetical protein